MGRFFTSGQVAKRLRISVSTLKRWHKDSSISVSDVRNSNGWRLYDEADLDKLLEFKRTLKRNGKRFNEKTLVPAQALPVGGKDQNHPA